MPDPAAQQRTGSRDDLRLDNSRCLSIRFSESGCRRCVEICPHNAISIDDQLSINPQRCTGCLLCTTVCPSGALEINHSLAACRAALAKVANPVLGCCRTVATSNSTLACLGGLSDEHVAFLTHSLTGNLTLNLGNCDGCPNSAMLPLLLQRVQWFMESGMEQGGCRIGTADVDPKVVLEHQKLDRRSFFSSLRSTLFQSAAVVMHTATEPVERSSSYGDKRVPQRRELLNLIIPKLTAELQQLFSYHFVHQVSFSPGCTACQGCVAICPSGALTTRDRHQQPDFVPVRCTGCELCVEFCLDRAIQLQLPPQNR